MVGKVTNAALCSKHIKGFCLIVSAAPIASPMEHSMVSAISPDKSAGIERIIQEYVPGKQVTLAHLLANPTEDLCTKVGVEHADAIGILTLTPGETAIIAGDIATKFAAVEIGFLDRFSGALVLTGSIGSVEEALNAILSTLHSSLGYRVCQATRT